MRYKRILFLALILSCAVSGFAQYVGGFPGAWYNHNGLLYIVNPRVPNECEIGHLIIDCMFKVSQNPEIGIVYAMEDTSWQADEVINFPNGLINVRDVLYAPNATPIDVFGSRYGRKQDIVMPETGDPLAKRIYTENGIEIIKAGTTKEYYDLTLKLKDSRVVIFNDITEPPYKYIFKDMELIDYGDRSGENDYILTELINDSEITLNWFCDSSRGKYPGEYEMKIHYKVYDVPKIQPTHEVIENLRLRLDQSQTAGIIRTMTEGSKVQILEVGNNELIDGTDANWVKVLTEDGYTGWCFSGFLAATLTQDAASDEDIMETASTNNELISNNTEINVVGQTRVWFLFLLLPLVIFATLFFFKKVKK